MNFALLTSAVLLLFILFGSLRKRSFWRAAIAAFVLAILVAAYLAFPSVTSRGGGEDAGWKQTAWLFAAMIVGMMSKYLWDLIENRRVKLKLNPVSSQKTPLDFDFWDFIQPMLVSGIVFSGVAGSHPKLELTTFLFSFQNGFFWQSILTRKKQVIETVG